MSQRLASLIIKLLGAPPPRTASLEIKRHYTRRLYLRILPPQIIAYGLLIILDAPTWLLIVPAAGAAAWLCGFALVQCPDMVGASKPARPSSVSALCWTCRRRLGLLC
jgi:hypothetical protein